LSEEQLSPSGRILLLMHNLCLVRPENSQNCHELSDSAKMPYDEVLRILDRHEAEGYVASLVNQSGTKRYYLTGSGMIKVCSSFT